MSRPVQQDDLDAHEDPHDVVEVREGRRANVGGMDIVRVLPTKGRRTVGREEPRLEVGDGGGRVMLLGGEPFERVTMWWNFVGRSTEEITEARRAWQDRDTDRVGAVPSDLDRIDAPRPPWLGPGG